MQAHLYDLRSEVEDDEWVDRFAADLQKAVQDPAERAMLDYAERLTRRPSDCSADDIEALRKHGFDEEGISSIVQVVSYFNYVNRIAEGLGIEPEDWLDPIGRPKTEPPPHRPAGG